MAYKFTDTVEEPVKVSDSLNPDAIVLIKESNQTLEELVDGYKTITTKGRNLRDVDVMTADTGGNGKYYLSKRYKEIDFEITGVVYCENSKELNEKVRKIFNLLNVNELEFTFFDEREWKRTGLVVSVEVEAGVLNAKVTIKINCPDPFKRKIINEHKNLSEDEKYNDWLSYGIKEHSGLYQPKKLVINYNLASTVTSEGIKIDACDLDGNVVKSIKTLPYSEIREQNTMEIKFKSSDGKYLSINGYDGTRFIDISSNIADFGVPENGYIVIRNSDVEAYAVCEAKELG